jgi:transposase
MHDRVCPPRRMRFSFESRCRLVSLLVDGMSPQAAVAACGASRARGYRLWGRYQEGGWAALRDRPPVPKHQPRRLSRELEQRILAAREQAKAGPLIVAAGLGLPASTVWKVLRRYGVSRLRRPARGPIVRYERERPGELVHVDIKRLGRFWTIGKRVLGSDVGNRSRQVGWQYLTWRSTTTHASPTRSCSRAKARPTASRSCAGPSAGTQREASASSASSPATATAPSPGTIPASSSGSSGVTRVRVVRRPTARPKRWSRRSYANGLIASPIRRASTAPVRSPATCAGTTNTDRTAHSEANHRSAASHRSVGPTSRPRARTRAASRSG